MDKMELDDIREMIAILEIDVNDESIPKVIRCEMLEDLNKLKKKIKKI